jgi:hypothetical protein
MSRKSGIFIKRKPGVMEKGTLLNVLKVFNNPLLPGMNFESLSHVPSSPLKSLLHISQADRDPGSL